MYRIKLGVVVLFCSIFLSACGQQEKKEEVLLYQEKGTKKKEEHYETTKVKRQTYEVKIATTGELEYQNQKSIIIHEDKAYLDKICVKEGQKVKKGDTLAIYHLKVSDTTMKKKKLELEQQKSEYEISLKSKKNECLEKERMIKNLVTTSEKKLAQLELKRLKEEYRQIQKEEKTIQKQEKEYRQLEAKRKKAILKSKYDGEVADIESYGDVEEESVSGETLMKIRDKKNFLVVAENGTGMRYNMTLDIGLGRSADDITHHIKGKVISTDNLLTADETGEEMTEQEAGSDSQKIQISKADREKYDFSKYNIFISGISMKVENALVVDASAVYKEPVESEERLDNEKLFVYVLEGQKLHKRYIVSNYKQDKCYLVNQGLEEGQILAILDQ